MEPKGFVHFPELNHPTQASEQTTQAEVDYSAVWDNFAKTIAERNHSWLIRESLGARSLKEFVLTKINDPRFFRGSFRLFGVPAFENGKIIDFVMTNDHIPRNQIVQEISRILKTTETEVDPASIEITFKGRLITDDEDFAYTFNWHGRGGEIFNLTIKDTSSSFIHE